MEEINNWNEDRVLNEVEPIESSDSEDEATSISENEPEEQVTSLEAVNLFNKAIIWATNNQVSPNKINVLQSLLEKAVVDIISKKKVQTKITSYFAK